MMSRAYSRITLRTFACMLALILSGVLLLLVQVAPASAAVPINRNRIKQVLYPTLGFPEIVRCGDTLSVEFDPRDQNWSQGLPTVNDFQASLVTSNSAYPITEQLELEHFYVGYSTHWPEYSQYVQPRAKIYIAAFKVHEDVPLDLYDLTVRGHMLDGSWLTDSQPHAVQTVVQYKDDYTIAQLSDIHVWGPEASYPGSTTHQRNYRHESYSETDGYGAAYYHKEIQQVNVQKPDFVVYTGDYDFSQKWLYQENYGGFNQYKNTPWNGKYYEPWFEMDWFYQETLKLDVPVFMTIGNHDAYARYDLLNISLEEDYMNSWRDLFSPQYFSFDYGPDYHFTSINTMDWTSRERNLHWVIPDVILNPGKWQGQISSGGDAFEAGWTQAREDAINVNNFTGQLLWLKNDLESHASAKMRTILSHTDPWKLDGSGVMFDDGSILGGGKGAGRLAIIKLARLNNVALFLSGHDHSDSYGSISWSAGGGQVDFVNTTACMFQDSDVLFPDWTRMWVYPGFRMIRVSDGDVVNFFYKLANDQGGQPLQYSWPFFAGTNVGGETNFANLVNPALSALYTPTPGSAENVTVDLTNHLCGQQIFPGGPWSGDVPSAYMEFPMPYLSGGYYYVLTNAMFGDIYDSADAGATHRVYQAYANLPHAPNETDPSTLQVTLNKSAVPDLDPPTCDNFLINGGAPATDVAEVTLSNDAVDVQSGMLDMMISNDDPTFAGCEWQRWESSTSWTLKRQGGARTVYVKFRDRAMPGNVSDVKSASITLTGSAPSITSVSPDPARVGQAVEIEGTDFGAPPTPSDRVLFNGLLAEVTSWTDTEIECVVPHGATTGIVTVMNDAGNDSVDFNVSPTIEAISPDFGYNDEVVSISNLEGTGFYEQGSPPSVKLTDGTNEIAASDVTVVSAQSITCKFDLRGASVGPRNVVLTNPDGNSAQLNGAFHVDYPPPKVYSIAPDSGVNDSAVQITDLRGDDFRNGAQVYLMRDGGTTVEATDVVVVSGQKITCELDLNGVATGAWDVYVENDDGEGGTLEQAFTVENPAPSVTRITPSNGRNDRSVAITDLAGADFRNGATVCLRAAGQPDIAASGVNVVSGNRITCDFDLNGVERGFRDVVVTNDDGKSGVLENGFDVDASNPRLDGLSPSSASPGANVTLSGMDFGAQQGTSYVTFNGTRVTDYGSWADGKVVARIPEGATSGPVQVVTDLGRSNSDRIEAVLYPSWYLAEGSSAHGMETRINIENPNGDDLNARVKYMLTDGTVKELPVGLPARSQVTLDPSEVVGAADFSTSVSCTSLATIAVDRTMSWTGSGAASPETHSSIGVTTPSKTWYLPEGSSAWGFETWLLIQNPGTTSARCNVTYMVEGMGPRSFVKDVPAGSRASFDMAADIGAADASIKVESDQGVIPERSMYRNARREGSCSIGTTSPATSYYLAEGTTAWGFTTYVLVQNPNPVEASVTLTYMTAEGPVPQEPFDMPPNSRKTIRVNDVLPLTDFSTKVASSVPIIAERSMFWGAASPLGEACHDSIGVAAPHTAFLLPDGQAGMGAETYVLVQNPNTSEVKVRISYLSEGGDYETSFTAVVPANSRSTFDMADRLETGRASVVVTSLTQGRKIICERAMYSTDRGAGAETVGACAD